LSAEAKALAAQADVAMTKAKQLRQQVPLWNPWFHHVNLFGLILCPFSYIITCDYLLLLRCSCSCTHMSAYSGWCFQKPASVTLTDNIIYASHVDIRLDKQISAAMLISRLPGLQPCRHIVEPNVCAGE